MLSNKKWRMLLIEAVAIFGMRRGCPVKHTGQPAAQL
jgi:hypothetical protein